KFLQDVHDDPRGGAAELILGRAAIDDCANYRTLERLSMYERRIESSMLRTLKELESRQVMRELREREAAEERFVPEGGSSPVRKGDLKKQSQFAPELMGAKPCVLRAYENTPRRGLGGKQTQTKPMSRRAHSPNSSGRRLGAAGPPVR
ncbi:MAG: hypothetical protein PVJ86_06425, partial [Phycisphaerales bacterium]